MDIAILPKFELKALADTKPADFVYAGGDSRFGGICLVGERKPQRFLILLTRSEATESATPPVFLDSTKWNSTVLLVSSHVRVLPDLKSKVLMRSHIGEDQPGRLIFCGGRWFLGAKPSNGTGSHAGDCLYVDIESGEVLPAVPMGEVAIFQGWELRLIVKDEFVDESHVICKFGGPKVP